MEINSSFYENLQLLIIYQNQRTSLKMIVFDQSTFSLTEKI